MVLKQRVEFFSYTNENALIWLTKLSYSASRKVFQISGNRLETNGYLNSWEDY